MASVFFSWQADRPQLTGRNFVERALERAAEQLNKDLELVAAEREPVEIDRDTKGVPGSPLILETIFKKIDGCRAFVADLTFVGARAHGEFTPNPNVLIEYGWALKSKGRSVIVGVMNTAYGKPDKESLPFDLRHQRHPLTYHLEDDADEPTRIKVKAQLVADLKMAIGAILGEAVTGVPVLLPERFVPRPAVDGGGRLVEANERWGVRSEQLMAEHQDIFLEEGPVAWLRLFPKHVGAEGQLDLLNSQLEPIVRNTSNKDCVDPLVVASEQSFFRRHDGFGIYAHLSRTDRTPSLAVLFKNGEIWAADRFILNEQEGEVILLPELRFFQALDKYMRVYRSTLRIPLPWLWEAGVEGLDEKFLEPSTPRNAFPVRRIGPATHDRVSRRGEIHAVDARPQDVLRPFIEAVYDAFGGQAPEWLFEQR